MTVVAILKSSNCHFITFLTVEHNFFAEKAFKLCNCTAVDIERVFIEFFKKLLDALATYTYFKS